MQFTIISLTSIDEEDPYFLNEPPNEVVKEVSEEKEYESVEATKEYENLNNQEN